MPLALQKVVALLIMPVGFLWLLLLAGSAFAFWRRRWRAGAALLAVALLYGAAGSIYLGAALMAGLEARVPRVDVAAQAPFDAVFVLGGGSDEDPLGQPELGVSGDRIAQAARLWHAGKARLLVTSGFGRDGVNGLQNEGEANRTLWLALGVPERAILVVKEPCWVTGEEIAAYRRLQERFGWKRMALVSSAWHLPRALRLAARAGLVVTPVGADWKGRRHPFQVRSLVPQPDGFLNVQRACWEHLGRWVGR